LVTLIVTRRRCTVWKT